MTTSPNAPDAKLAPAMQLGWHVAELYALVDDTGEPVSDTLLPSHAGLSRQDQVELQLRAAAGDASRAGATSEEASLEALLEAGRAAPSSPEAAEAFRRQLRQCHIEVQKDLWARDALAGKAYELGNGLSDTYGRICCAYRHADEDERATWLNVFERPRLERLKRLLDDLSSRLNASGVAVVRAQFDTWQREVHTQLKANRVPSVEHVRDGLRRQTIIWCQLLTGDKEPEAYLDRHARSDLRDELRRLIWRRYRRWLIPIGAVLFLFALLLPHLIRLYETGSCRPGSRRQCSPPPGRSASPRPQSCSRFAAVSTSGLSCCGIERSRRRCPT